MQFLQNKLNGKSQEEVRQIIGEIQNKMQVLNLKKCWVDLNKSKPVIYLQPCSKPVIEVSVDDLKKIK